MNNNIYKLFTIAGKPKRTVIGLMSGTSLDGLDIALCNIIGSGLNTKLDLIHFETIPYSDDFKNEVKTVFSKSEISLEKLTVLNPWIALQHAEMINTCLHKWGIDKNNIDLIASHGQTIYHAPVSLHNLQNVGNATLQIGDGDHLAVATGIITISDFRQKNIAAGGEGAPLAVYGDYLLFSKKGEDRILLNIGGIANFTFLPGNDDGNIVCTDTGPGNTLMDAFIQEQFPGRFYDTDALIARTGVINDELLTALISDTFFSLDLPKTTGPELFNLSYLVNAKKKSNNIILSVADTLATLNKFTAVTIATAIKNYISNKTGIKIFISGGGIYNPLLLEHLNALLPECCFCSTLETGINPDAKEAILFALLANECVSGSLFTFENSTQGIIPVSMGKISFPD